MIRFSQFCCLLVVALALHVPTRSLAFLSTRTKSPSQTTTVKTPLYASSSSSSSSKSKSASVQEQQQQQQQQNNNNEVTRLRQEAARIRLEAEQLDASLTLRKIDTLQRKFQHAKKPEEKQEILAQLKQLKRKVKGKEDLEENDTMVQLPSQTMTAAAEEKVTHQKVPSPNKAAEQSKPGATLQPVKNKDESNESSDGVSLPTGFVRTEQPEGIATHAETNKQVESSESSSNTNISTSTFTNTTINTEHSPVAGFDPEDLELYVPICWEIEERLPNLTLREKMEVFRTEPRLQQHFSDKITALLLQPMQDMQQLEELRSQYLYSSSSVEKKELKRQIDALQTQMDLQLQQQEHQQQDADESGAVTYSDSLYHELPPINMTERLEAIRALPPTLQAVYKSRNKLEPKDEDDDDDNNSTLELAIMLDYWDYQLQLLEQIPYVHPITDNMRAQVTQAVQNLPLPVRRHVLVSQLQQQNVTSTVLEDVEGIVNQLCSEERKAAVDDEDLMGSGSPWAQFHQGGISVKVEAPEYNDIEFVDRSRFVKELYPSLARMEMVHPTPELVEDFMKECLDRKSFMVTSKPERVMGGYYIRGQNVISGDEEAGGIQLSTRIQERLQASEQLNEKLEFFYITDPSPVSDESFEMGYTSADPVIFLTTKEPSVLYEHAEPLTKFVVASCGVASIALFALATCELQPLLAERIEAALLAENPDVSFLTNIFLQSVFSMAAIQFSHEAAHRVVAWKDKVRSITLLEFPRERKMTDLLNSPSIRYTTV